MESTRFFRSKACLMFAALAVTIVPACSAVCQTHSADVRQDWKIDLGELLRVVQFYNSPGYGCATGTEDGYTPGGTDPACVPHDSDYDPQDWRVNLSELLRLVQLYSSFRYHPEAGGEDGFATGLGAEWTKFHSASDAGADYTVASAAVGANDGGLWVAGFAGGAACPSGEPPCTPRPLLLRLNAEGEEIWQRRYDVGGDAAQALGITLDTATGELVVTGERIETGPDGTNRVGFLLRTNQAGDMVDLSAMADVAGLSLMGAASLAEGGIIAVGSTLGSGTDSLDGWVSTVDAGGDFVTDTVKVAECIVEQPLAVCDESLRTVVQADIGSVLTGGSILIARGPAEVNPLVARVTPGAGADWVWTERAAITIHVVVQLPGGVVFAGGMVPTQDAGAVYYLDAGGRLARSVSTPMAIQSAIPRTNAVIVAGQMRHRPLIRMPDAALGKLSNSGSFTLLGTFGSEDKAETLTTVLPSLTCVGNVCEDSAYLLVGNSQEFSADVPASRIMVVKTFPVL